ncbi:MAG: LacI family transcriptional regulator, partial [Spartobacteria bacterium]|nr:LacI family transcriptional regulator [Spartobacteria bacterium]
MVDEKKTTGSIYDVARASGVSIGTVSRVFNNKPDVADYTRVTVMKAAKMVNYLPRISTRRLNIGLVVQEIEKAGEVGFVSDIISTLSRHMALCGGVLDLVSMRDIDAVYRNFIRGLIAVTFDMDFDVLKALKNTPVVLINNMIEGGNLHHVASDHKQGARMATAYLLAHGHRDIGFLEVLEGSWGSLERQAGFREAYEHADMKAPPHLMAFCGTHPAEDALKRILDQKPTALLVCGEDLSLEISRILIHEMKVNIPEELSLITYENPGVSALLSPRQTTIAQPWDEIGKAAVDRIMGLVDG